MRHRSIALLVTFLAIMSSLAFAIPGHKKKISLAEPTFVGTVLLLPGEYTMEWRRADGRTVEVSFMQGVRTIVNLPATIEAAQNGHNLDLIFGQADRTGTRSLVAIEMRGSTLFFP